MSKNYEPLNKSLHDYLLQVSLQESESAKRLRLLSDQHEFSYMLTPPEQSQFLAFLLKLMNAKRVIEVGIFTGYTTLVMAEALPADGELIACDKNADWVAVGKPFWLEANVDSKISVCIDSALITLQNLLDEGQADTFDFIYVDADKIHYSDYLRLGLQLIHSRGLMVFDNVLKLGRDDGDVPDRKIPSTRALDDFNRALQKDESLNISMLPMGYGVTLVRNECR